MYHMEPPVMQDFRSGLRLAVHALDEPGIGGARGSKVHEVSQAMAAQKKLLHSWLAQRQGYPRAMVMSYLQANLQQPIQHVVQAQHDMLVGLSCLQLH